MQSNNKHIGNKSETIPWILLLDSGLQTKFYGGLPIFNGPRQRRDRRMTCAKRENRDALSLKVLGCTALAID